MYVDATCTSALGRTLAGHVPAAFFATTFDPALRFVRDGGEYYELREPYTKPIYVTSPDETCASYAPPVPYVAYQVSAVARSAFAPATLVIDP